MPEDPKNEEPELPEHVYDLSYVLRVNKPGLNTEEAQKQAEEGWGACNAAILLSILFPPDGSYSMMLMSKDGRTNEPLPDHEVFKAWWLLAERLGRSTTLDEGRRLFAKAVFEQFRILLVPTVEDEGT